MCTVLKLLSNQINYNTHFLIHDKILLNFTNFTQKVLYYLYKTSKPDQFYLTWGTQSPILLKLKAIPHKFSHNVNSLYTNCLKIFFPRYLNYQVRVQLDLYWPSFGHIQLNFLREVLFIFVNLSSDNLRHLKIFQKFCKPLPNYFEQICSSGDLFQIFFHNCVNFS